ncbi:hypothetical protein D0Z03_001751 [Geotrichum reessii]|nr:hypothetical protein D0Z03_001751 [Galactomyces reessii]
MFANPFVYYTPDTSYSRPSQRRSCAPSIFEQSYFDIDQLNALRTAEIQRKQRQQAELRRQYEHRLAQIEEYHRQQEIELSRREAYTKKIREQRRLQAQKQAEEEQRRRLQHQAEAQKYNEYVYKTINNFFDVEQANGDSFGPGSAFQAFYSILNGPSTFEPFEKKTQEQPKATENEPEVSSQKEPTADSLEDDVIDEAEENIIDPTDVLNTLLSTFNCIVNESASQSEPENTKAETHESSTKNPETVESLSDKTDETALNSEPIKSVVEEAPVSDESSPTLESVSDKATTTSTSESVTPELTHDTAEEDEATSEEEYVLVEENDGAAAVSSEPELSLTDTLNTISKKIEHNVAVYNRVSKHSVEAYSDSDSDSVSSLSTASESSSSAAALILRSRIKVLQRAQLQLENLYEELDNLELPANTSDKRFKQVLTGKAVSYADKVDELRLKLVDQLETIKANNTALSTTDNTESDANDSFSTSEKKQSDKPTVRHIMVETVQDEALSD